MMSEVSEANHVEGLAIAKIALVERLSVTFTANGKMKFPQFLPKNGET